MLFNAKFIVHRNIVSITNKINVHMTLFVKVFECLFSGGNRTTLHRKKYNLLVQAGGATLSQHILCIKLRINFFYKLFSNYKKNKHTTKSCNFRQDKPHFMVYRLEIMVFGLFERVNVT